MRRMNNLVTLFTAMTAFFFGTFVATILLSVDKCPAHKSGVAKLDPHPDLFLIVLVLSAPLNTLQRQAMRDTWLQYAQQPLKLSYYPEDFIYLPKYNERGHLEMETVAEQANRKRIYLDWLSNLPTAQEIANHAKRNIKMKYFFGIGTANLEPGLRAELDREQGQNKDLLLLPRLHDTYANLTEKMLHALDALTYHYDYSYLLKVDDDTYVKLDYLVNELVSYDRKLLRKTTEYGVNQPLPQLYWGYFNGRANIKVKGQWAETNYYLAKNYIAYAQGGGYVLSRKICEFVANNSQYLTTYVSEDVSMGTWLAPLRQIYRRHDPRFDTGYMPRKCRHDHLVLHKRNVTIMRDLFAGKMCTFEVSNEARLRRPTEYYYDWHKTSDKCCDSPVA